MAPVIEVTGNYYFGLGRQSVEAFNQQRQLLIAMGLAQAQVHAHCMHLFMPRHLQAAMEQATLLIAVDGYIPVVELADGEFRQQGIAVRIDSASKDRERVQATLILEQDL